MAQISTPPYPFDALASSCPTLSSSPLLPGSPWTPIPAFKVYTLIFVLPKPTHEGEQQKVNPLA